MRATAAAARTRISHIPKPTSGHLDRVRCCRCPFGNSRFHPPHDREKTNSNPTSGRLKVEFLIVPLDTSKSKLSSDFWPPKKKIETKRTIKMSRSQFRNSRFHHRHAPSRRQKHAKYIAFPCVLSTSSKSKRFQKSDRQRDRRYKHFSKIHLRISMFF